MILPGRPGPRQVLIGTRIRQDKLEAPSHGYPWLGTFSPSNGLLPLAVSDEHGHVRTCTGNQTRD
jgi:hypothetical protein